MTTKQLRDVIFIVQSETVLRWYRDLVRRKWAQNHSSSVGRPPIKPEIEQLIFCFVHENDWGLQQDYEAVYAALATEWSNGQTEGQVNRLKFIKRQIYGRAKFDLLRICVLALP